MRHNRGAVMTHNEHSESPPLAHERHGRSSPASTRSARAPVNAISVRWEDALASAASRSANR